MSAYHSETSFESTALIPVPDTLPSNDSDPQFPSQLINDFNIGIHGFDEFNPPFSDEFKMKTEETTFDDSGFDFNWLDFGSVSKDDVKFQDPSNLGDVNAIADSDALSSEQLLSIVFGEDQTMVEFPDLQLTNDVFAIANKESAVDIFPSLNRSVSAVSLAPQSSDTYKWRGDMGLLDRLSYGNSKEIPRSWAMTSLDADEIAQYQFAPLEAPPQMTDLWGESETTEGIDEPPQTSMQLAVGLNTERGDPPSEPLKKKRTRIDKKKREKGNNPYGRSGVLKCFECRRRNWKCVYSSADKPCGLCVKKGLHPCIKGKANEHPRYPEIHDAFNRPLWLMEPPSLAKNDATFRPIIQGFGSAKARKEPRLNIDRFGKALEAAVYAWKSRQLNAREYVETAVGQYMLRACALLGSATRFNTVKPSGVFAALLLGWLAYSTCSKESKAPSHLMGSLEFLIVYTGTARIRNKSLPENVTTYGPFIIDCANAWQTRHGRIPIRLTNFSQRVKYFDEIRNADDDDAWHAGTLEAANSTLGNLMEVALTWVYNIALREVDFNFSRDNVPEVLQYIRSELGDVALYTNLKTLNASFQGAQTNHTTVEGQLITRVFHRLRCILLLLTLLESESIGLGLLTPKANFIATSAIRFCRAQSIRRDGPIEDYYLISWHNFSHLLLGGIGLPVDESTELCAWIITELEFIGKEECARTLESIGGKGRRGIWWRF